MADTYLNQTGLAYYHNRAKTVFAGKEELSALDAKVDEIISEGGEPNTIETVKVNGTALTPDAQKAVDVTVPTATSGLTNDGDGESQFATQSYVDENGGKIDSISVNGTAQTIDANKNVDLDVPEYLYKSDSGLTSFAIGAYAQYVDQTERVKEGISIRDWKHTDGGTEYPVIEVQFFKENGTLGPGKRVPSWVAMKDYVASVLPANVSDLTNDSGYQTASDVSNAIDAAVASAFTYKGAVATESALPSTGNKVGDVYDVQDTGVNYAWSGTAWDALGAYVDTSTLWAKNELTAITTAEIDALFA